MCFEFVSVDEFAPVFNKENDMEGSEISVENINLHGQFEIWKVGH